MIPFDFITEWRQHAPWVQDAQVEQDLIIARALVEMFNQDDVANALAFRGGTALYKLHLQPAVRYSEDIDLVQVAAGPIGVTLDAIRGILDPWLGDPKRAFKEGSTTLVYRAQSEGMPPLPLRLKIEINTREHFNVFGLEKHNFNVQSRWFSGGARGQDHESLYAHRSKIPRVTPTRSRTGNGNRNASTAAVTAPQRSWPMSIANRRFSLR